MRTPRIRFTSAFLWLCIVLMALGVALLGMPGAQGPAQAAGFTVTCKGGTNPFPSDMGTDFPVKENSAARLEAFVSGGTGPFTYEWNHVGGNYDGSGNPYTFTTPADGYGWWSYQVKVTDTATGEVQSATCGFHVLPNPADRLDPGNPPSVNPVLFIPKDTFPGDVVPQDLIDQLQRAMRRIQAGYYEIYGATFRMNPLKVVVAPQTEAQMCGGDCTDRLQSGTLVYNYALPQAKQAVGGIIPYTKDLLVLAWGAGGWAGSWGPGYTQAAVGDWSIASAGGVKTPAIEPDVGWQLDGIGVFDPNANTLAHELNHNIGWDDPHNFRLDTPPNAIEITATRALPWVTEPLDDVENPTVSFTSPGSGATVSGTIAVNLSAADTGGSGLDAVALVVDDRWHGIDTSAPYSFSLDTTEIGHGNRKLTAIAYDNTGHIGKTEITVNVQNVVPGACSTSYPEDTGRVCYYDGVGFEGTYLGTLMDPPDLVTDNGNYGLWPKHDFGTGEVAFGQSDTVSGVWRARFNFPAVSPSGRYQFTFTTDAGVRFYVNDELILDAWSQNTAFTSVVALSGYTNLRIEWYENDSSAKLSVKWQPTWTLDDFNSTSLKSNVWSTATSGPAVILDENFDSGSLNGNVWSTASSGQATLLEDNFSSTSLNTSLWGTALAGGSTLLEDNFNSGSLNTELWGTLIGGSGTVRQSGGYLQIQVPVSYGAYADVFSRASFPVGSTFEASVYVSAGQYQNKGIGYSNSIVSSNCGSGETQAAMWRGQSSNKYTVTKAGTGSYTCTPRAGYPTNWTTIKIVRVSSSQVDFYEGGVFLGSHTTNIPSANLPIRFSASVSTSASFTNTIYVDWVKVTLPGSSPTVSLDGNYLQIAVPAGLSNAYAELYSKASFSVGTVFEARVYVSAGQASDYKGIGYANARLGTSCASGETQAAMWRGQESGKHTETKTSASSFTCTLQQTGYPEGWRTLKIVRVSASQVDFYEDGVLLGSHTTNIPSADLPIRFGVFTSSQTTILIDWVKITRPGVEFSQSGGYLTITLPPTTNAYADLYSRTAFPVGSTFEARVNLSAGQSYDYRGIGYATGRVGSSCSSGEVQAAMWRGQGSAKYTETKVSATSYTCTLRQSGYPAGWRTIKIVRVSSTQVDFYENGVLLGSQTTNVPQGNLPVRFSASTSSVAPSNPITIQIDWVRVISPGPTVSQGAGFLFLTVPAGVNGYVDLYSNASFPVGTAFEAQIMLQASQGSRSGIGYADGPIGADCSQGETQAAMRVNQDGDLYTETKTSSTSYTCTFRQADYFWLWKTVRIVRTSNSRVDFYDDGVLVGTQTTNVPTGDLPVRFSIYAGPASGDVSILVDSVRVTPAPS